MTTEPRPIELYWSGPHNPFEDGGKHWEPPRQPGVYVFTIEPQGASQATPIITYVGEASNLLNRLNEHIFYYLGGGYALLEDAVLGEEEFSDYAYLPKPMRENLVEDYLNDYERMSKLAIANLKRYRFSWAVLNEERLMRQAVESALINTAEKPGQMENAKLSRAASNVEPLVIEPKWIGHPEVRIPALARPVAYGTAGSPDQS